MNGTNNNLATVCPVSGCYSYASLIVTFQAGERLAHSGSVSDLHAASLHGAWPLRAATAEDARGGRVEVRVRLQVHRRARSVSDRPRAHSAAARRSRCIVRNGIGGSSRG